MVSLTLGGLGLQCSPPCPQKAGSTHSAALVGELWQFPRLWSAAVVAGSARPALRPYLCMESAGEGGGGISVWVVGSWAICKLSTISQSGPWALVGCHSTFMGPAGHPSGTCMRDPAVKSTLNL